MVAFDVLVRAAAVLVEGGYCSECRVKAMWAGGRDMRVCPVCYSLLWHRDWLGEDRARAAALSAANAERTAAARREKRRRRDGIARQGEGCEGDGGVQAGAATFGERLRAAREIAEAGGSDSVIGGEASWAEAEEEAVGSFSRGGEDGEEGKGEFTADEEGGGGEEERADEGPEGRQARQG